VGDVIILYNFDVASFLAHHLNVLFNAPHCPCTNWHLQLFTSVFHYIV